MFQLARAQALLKRHNASGRKFNYPQRLYVDPKAALYEGAGAEMPVEAPAEASSDEEVKPRRQSVLRQKVS